MCPSWLLRLACVRSDRACGATQHNSQRAGKEMTREERRQRGDRARSSRENPKKKASTRTKDEKRFRAKETRARERRLKWSYRERKKKSPIGTSFRRVAISLWTWLLLRRCCLLTFFFRKIMIHKISSLRFSLCFLFSFSTSSLLLLLTTFRFDRTRRTTTVGASEERDTQHHSSDGQRLCVDRNRIYIYTSKATTKSEKMRFWYRARRDKKKFILFNFFLQLLLRSP